MIRDVIKFRKMVNEKNITSALEDLGEFMKKYPDSPPLIYYYSVLLNKNGEMEKAIEYLKQIDYESDSNACCEIIKSYIYTENYDEALRVLDKLNDLLNNMTEVDPIKKEFLEKGYILCLDKIGVLNSDYRIPMRKLIPYLKHTLDYNEEYAIKYIKNKKQYNIEHNQITFNDKVSLEQLYYEVFRCLESGECVQLPCANSLDDVYYFSFPGLNNMNDFTYNLLLVSTLRGTNKIYRMNINKGDINEKYINYINLENVIIKEKQLVKSRSQIEKFNKKYNL